MKNIITISREFGSGGRTIGKEVAKKLDYSYYDREIIEEIALRTGLAERYIEENSEYSKSNIFSFGFLGRNSMGQALEDYLYKVQRSVILDIAKKGNCVIVGRCADYILRNRDDVLNVFIHASKEERAKRIVRRYGQRDETPEKRLEDKDKSRRANYNYYTDREWGMSQNYHISIDSGIIGIDNCVELIIDLVKKL